MVFSSANAEPLISLLETMGFILISLGGALTLLMFAMSAMMFMTSAGNAARAQRAMLLAKNTVIGIAILAGGVFLRSVVTNVVSSTETTKTAQEPTELPVTLLVIIAVTVLGMAVAGTIGSSVIRKRAAGRVNRESMRAWASQMEPGLEGPFVPEEGYEVLVPEKRQELDPAGNVAIRFLIALYRFDGAAWIIGDEEVTVEDLSHRTKREERPRFVTRALGLMRKRSAYPTRPEFEQIEKDVQTVWPATTPIEVLAAEWFDFGERVRTQNRMAWARMTDEQIEDEMRKEELANQLKIAELLPGNTSYDSLTAQLAEKLGVDAKR